MEISAFERVHWFDHQQLLGPLGGIPPAEFEQVYYLQQSPAVA